jgi:hypothetical protein
LTFVAALAWLERLRVQAPTLRPESAPRPCWSQKRGRAASATAMDLPTTVHRCQATIQEMENEHWFARTLGYDCVDGNGEPSTTLEEVLGRRVGKPQLTQLAADQWTEDDLCDYIEVLHDLAARPTTEWFHSYGGCGWHPTRYDRASGQALYRWRINQVLDASTLHLRLANEGEDTGRVVRVLSDSLDDLVIDLADITATNDPTVPHAISIFRRHGATREDRRAAVRELADVLEAHRPLLKQELMSKDEAALFHIANQFEIRHRNTTQQNDYSDEYLDWIFHWYLATVDLIRRLVGSTGSVTSPRSERNPQPGSTAEVTSQ